MIDYKIVKHIIFTLTSVDSSVRVPRQIWKGTDANLLPPPPTSLAY